MAKRKRGTRPSRLSKKVFYFIVEGCTEENYLKLLKQFYKKDAKILNCNGGNAIGVLRKAKIKVKRCGDDYTGYVVWFDGDKYFPAKDSNLKNQIESKKNVEVYMSKPCIENWLLAHFEHPQVKHSTCYNCEKKLQKYIKHYKKNDCHLLKKHINPTNIQVAIANYPQIGEIPKTYFI